MFSPEFLHYPGSHELPRDFMSMFSDSIMADREGEREMERRKRQAQLERQKQAEQILPANVTFGPIFAEPVRVEHLDDISKRVCGTLGAFSNVRTNLMDMSKQNLLLGIPKQPMTPVDNKPKSRLFPSTAGQVPSTSGVPGSNGRVPAVCPESLSKVMQQSEMQAWRTQGGTVTTKTDVGFKPHSGGGGDNRPSAYSNTGNATGHKPVEGTKSDSPFKSHHSSSSAKQGSTDRSNAKITDKHKPTGSKPGNRGHAKPRSAKSSAADATSSESHSGPPNGAIVKPKKEFGPRDAQLQKSKSKKPDRTGQEPDSRTETDGVHKRADSSNVFEPAVHSKMPVRSLFDIDESDGKPIKMKPLPKLDIPLLTDSNCSNNHDVESILNIMTDMKSPVTAIQTPIKADTSSKFPFSLDKVKNVSGLTTIHEIKPITPLDAGETIQDLEGNLSGSGEDSERSDNEDVNKNKNIHKESMTTAATIAKTTTTTVGNATNEGELLEGEVTSGSNPVNMDNSRGSDSSSDDSSSSGSEESDSDSESGSEESAPESEEHEPAPKKYGLFSVIEKIQKQKSPATLSLPKTNFAGNNNGSTTESSPSSVSRTVTNGDAFPSKPANKKLAGVRHSGGFPLEVNDLMKNLSSSKQSGNFDKYSDGGMADFTELSNESKNERTTKKSPAKAKGKVLTKKAPTKNNSLKSNSVTTGASVKVETKKSSKTKVTKQSSKGSSSNGQVDAKPKTASKTTPKSEKKSLPKSSKLPAEKKGKKKIQSPKLPKSREFILSDDASDSDNESQVSTRSPAAAMKSPTCKENGASSMTDSTPCSPSSHKLSSAYKSNVLNSKGKNKTKPERNNSYTGSLLDDVFSSISPGDEPLLSPLKSPDLMSEITYKSGIPSLVVKFDLNDIENLPSKADDDGRTQSRTSIPHLKRERDVADGLDDRPPPLVKSKRKTEDMEPENLTSGSDSNKKPKIECSSKSPRTTPSIVIKEEPQHNESVIPESGKVLDRRRTPTYERRGSVTSVSSHQSNNSSSGGSRKSDKEHQPSKRQKLEHDVKREYDVKREFDIVKREYDIKREYDVVKREPDVFSDMINHNKHLVSSTEWGVQEERTDQYASSNGHKVSPTSEHKLCSEYAGGVGSDRFLTENSLLVRTRIDFADERQLTADDYLNEGKKLKRQADMQADKNVKALTYFDAVLSFILCGHTMENDPHISGEKAVTMYNETCEIIKFILKFKGTHQDATNTDKKLAVLCHRCQAFLYTRMYKLKKTHTMKMSKALGEHFKSQNKSQQGAQLAPSPWNNTKYTGTPSPMSPTPSPAGSVGSVGSMGSQGSTNCDLNSSQNFSSQNKLTNGVGPIATITIPSRIMDMMSRYLVFSNYGLYGLDFWEQSETMAQDHPEFFKELDQQCGGPLTLHSSTLALVQYARNGLHRLKKS